MIDFAALDNEIIHNGDGGEVNAVTLVNGEPAELIDAHWLFANHLGSATRSSAQMLCYLPADDPWIHNLLRPIVEAAGYRVIEGEAGDEEADLVIAAKGSALPESASGRRTIWLRSDPEAESKKDESIYRYDRAGLLMALKSASGGGR